MRHLLSMSITACSAVLMLATGVGAAGPVLRQTLARDIQELTAEVKQLQDSIAAIQAELSDPTFLDLRRMLGDKDTVICPSFAKDGGGTVGMALTTRQACVEEITTRVTLGLLSPGQASQLAVAVGRLRSQMNAATQAYIRDKQSEIDRLRNHLNTTLNQLERLRSRDEKTEGRPPTIAPSRDTSPTPGVQGGGTSDRPKDACDRPGLRGVWVRSDPDLSPGCGITVDAGSITITGKDGKTNQMTWDAVPGSIEACTPVTLRYAMTQNPGPWMEGAFHIEGRAVISPEGRLPGLTTDGRFPELKTSALKFKWDPDADSVVRIWVSSGNGDCTGRVSWTYTKK